MQQLTKLIQKIELKQLQQVVLQAELMELPPLVLDSLILDICKNPKEYEKNIKSKQGEDNMNSETNLNVRYFFDFVKTLSSERKAKKGIITTVPLEIIPKDRLRYIDLENIIVDGTYYARTSQDKPSFINSNHLNFSLKMQMLQIPKRYKNAIKLVNDLMRKRDWINRQLIKVYSYLGERQREFIGSLNSEKLNRCSYEDLTNELCFRDMSTTYRLVNNRFISIKNQQKSYIFPTNVLIVNYIDFKFYQVAKKINKIFIDELKRNHALSDNEIHCLLNENYKIGIPRRTIAGYRKRAGIPNAKERLRSYNSRKQDEFSIESEIERWIAYNNLNHNKF